MTIKVGDKIPTATMTVMTADGPGPVVTDAFFEDKKIVLFSVPGAFTPTCSAKHLPGFITHADAILAKGVDTIACMSVNDVFVMHAWGKDAGVGSKVVMLADGNGDFTKAIDLEMDGKGFGLGMRSKRFAMIVENGIVKELNIEEPGAFQVSSAEYVMGQL